MASVGHVAVGVALGRLGAALQWPFTQARSFFRVRLIPVAPIGAGRLVELLLFLPVWAHALWPRQAVRPVEE